LATFCVGLVFLIIVNLVSIWMAYASVSLQTLSYNVSGQR
jgi:hypothetical protein